MLSNQSQLLSKNMLADKICVSVCDFRVLVLGLFRSLARSSVRPFAGRICCGQRLTGSNLSLSRWPPS